MGNFYFAFMATEGGQHFFLATNLNALKSQIQTQCTNTKELLNYQEIPAAWVHPRCVNAHNCLGPTLGR